MVIISLSNILPIFAQSTPVSGIQGAIKLYTHLLKYDNNITRNCQHIMGKHLVKCLANIGTHKRVQEHLQTDPTPSWCASAFIHDHIIEITKIFLGHSARAPSNPCSQKTGFVLLINEHVSILVLQYSDRETARFRDLAATVEIFHWEY
jgi:hypothetical protein